VQNPANPQSLNRYSYCINNPLKYIDPTGHIVEFENDDIILGLLKAGLEIPADSPIWLEWMDLREAWYLLGTVAPKLTSYLENRPEIVTIQAKDTDEAMKGLVS
jgi:hypothetical protein